MSKGMGLSRSVGFTPLFIIFALVLLSSHGRAWGAERCPALLEKVLQGIQEDAAPPLLARSSAQGYAFELPEAGRLVTQSNELSTIPDGTYVYLIDSNSRVIYSPQTPLLGAASAEGQHLASHRSLAAKYETQLGKALAVRAAGEFHVTNGHVSEVNNRSKTYPGGSVNLDYAVKELEGSGLRVEDRTAKRDYSLGDKTKDRHLESERLSMLTALYGNTVEYKYLNDVYKKLSERYPDAEMPGFMDVSALNQRMAAVRASAYKNLDKLAQGTLSKDAVAKQIDLVTWQSFIVQKMQSEGTAAVVDSYFKRDPSQRPDFSLVIRGIEDIFLK